jgi:hypothetical protein
MTRFPVHISFSEPEPRPPRSSRLAPCLPHSLARQICLAPALVAFCLVLGEAEAGSAGKQPAEENRSVTSKRQRGTELLDTVRQDEGLPVTKFVPGHRDRKQNRRIQLGSVL